MQYNKPAITLTQQIQTLKQRGLIINDEAYAERLLGSIGYFRLAQYWRVLEADKVNHTFKPNSTFEKVLALYNFDKELKILIFSALQTIEVAMRAKVIYHFSMKHGAFWFMDEKLADKKSSFDENLEKLRAEVSRSYEDFIKDHTLKYDTPENVLANDILKYLFVEQLNTGFVVMTSPVIIFLYAGIAIRQQRLPSHLRQKCQ